MTKDFREEVIALIEYHIEAGNITEENAEDFRGVLETEAKDIERKISIIKDEDRRVVSQEFEDAMDAYSQNK